MAAPPGGECGRSEEFREYPSEGRTCVRSDGKHVHRFDDGTTGYSHGFDRKQHGSAHADEHANPAAPGHLSDIPAPSGTKPVDCVGGSSYRGRAIYAYPNDRTPRYAEVQDSFRTVIKQGNAFLDQEATFSGSGTTRARLKFYCNDAAEIAVASEKLGFSGANDSFTKIVDALNDTYNDPQTIYWVFYDDYIPDACGQGTVGHGDSVTSTPSPGPVFGITYRGCMHWGTPLHEATHNMGAVQDSAPHSTNAAHCNDGVDVMCYANDGGSNSNYNGSVCGNVQYDCNMNDYFHPKPSSGYLYNHWNLGFCANAYIARTGCITPPRNLRGSRRLLGGADLAWDAPTENGGTSVSRYEIYRGTCSTCSKSRIHTTGGSARSYYDSSATVGQEYWYHLRAANPWEDISGTSNEVKVPAT
jgi:hypothetical protein